MQESIRDKSLYSIDKKKRDRYLSRAVIQSLPDPYAAYYTKEDYEKLERRYSESYSGIGISVEEKKGKLLIAHVIKDGPAEQGGLRKGHIEFFPWTERRSTAWTMLPTESAGRREPTWC